MNRDKHYESQPYSGLAAPPRSLEFCPGCPHRMTYYALNRAIEQFRNGIILHPVTSRTLVRSKLEVDEFFMDVG